MYLEKMDLLRQGGDPFFGLTNLRGETLIFSGRVEYEGWLCQSEKDLIHFYSASWKGRDLFVCERGACTSCNGLPYGWNTLLLDDGAVWLGVGMARGCQELYTLQRVLPDLREERFHLRFPYGCDIDTKNHFYEKGGWLFNVRLEALPSSGLLLGLHAGYEGHFYETDPLYLGETLLFSRPTPNGLLFSFDSKMRLRWALSFPGRIAGMIADGQGRFYVAGRVDLRGAKVYWNRLRIENALSQLFFVAKFDEDGRLLWWTDVEGDGEVEIKSMAVAPDGTLAVVGGMYGVGAFGSQLFSLPRDHSFNPFRPFLAQVSPSGRFAWVRSLPTKEAFHAVALWPGSLSSRWRWFVSEKPWDSEKESQWLAFTSGGKEIWRASVPLTFPSNERSAGRSFLHFSKYHPTFFGIPSPVSSVPYWIYGHFRLGGE